MHKAFILWFYVLSPQENGSPELTAYQWCGEMLVSAPTWTPSLPPPGGSPWPSSHAHHPETHRGRNHCHSSVWWSETYSNMLHFGIFKNYAISIWLFGLQKKKRSILHSDQSCFRISHKRHRLATDILCSIHLSSEVQNLIPHIF